MSLADVMQPAIRHASRGFLATPYLHECIVDGASEMLRDKAISAIYLPNGTPLNAGDRVVQAEYAQTLATIARDGEKALYHGPLGDILLDYMKAHGGFVTREDLTSYKTVERALSGETIAAGKSSGRRRGGLRRAHRADAEHSRRLR